jgi:hypothetical protein
MATFAQIVVTLAIIGGTIWFGRFVTDTWAEGPRGRAKETPHTVLAAGVLLIVYMAAAAAVFAIWQ